MQRPNLYDYLKILALITMIVDHVWFLLYPDIEILRVVGRIAFPLFLFLVWYNHSYRIRPSLWTRGIILQIGMLVVTHLWYIDLWYINILLAIALTRVIMSWLAKQDNFSLEFLLLITSIVFAQSTVQRVDFGSLSIVFALVWYRVRKRWRSLYSSIAILLTMVSYILFVQQWFDFGQTNFIIRWVLWAMLAWAMLRMSRSNTSLALSSPQINTVMLRCSRNSLYLYVGQVVVIWAIYLLFIL